MQITGVSGNNLNVTRGLLGTTASAHTDGSALTSQLVTAQKTEINETTATGVSLLSSRMMTSMKQR